MAMKTLLKPKGFAIPSALAYTKVLAELSPKNSNVTMKRCSCVCHNPCACKCACGACACSCGPCRCRGGSKHSISLNW